MRHQSQCSSPSQPTPDSVFTTAYLARLREREESLTAGEAEYAGPWKCEPVPGKPGTVAVLRSWESLDRGDAPEAVFWHEETALLFAVVLPLVAREPLFHLGDSEESEGYPVGAVYGEQGEQVAGWLRRYDSRLIDALHLAEALARSPGALADLLDAAGPGAKEAVGRILARRDD
jgi:hypothetical protein